MEEENYISLRLATENEEKKKPSDLLAPTYPVWSTRWKCFQTYLGLTMSFLSVIKFCRSLIRYGFVVFVPHLLFTVFLAASAVLVEILFGRYGGGSVLRTWNMCPPARGLFACLFFVTCCLTIESNLLNVYVLKYLFSCFYGRMPWVDCNEHWAKENCYEIGKKNDAYLRCLTKHSREYCDKLKWQTSATQFWIYVISNSKGIHILWIMAYVTLSTLIVMAIVFKGISSMEKTIAHLVYIIFALCGLLAIISLSVPNAIKGFVKLSEYGWRNISNLNMWIEGFFNVFLSNCVGTLSLSFISAHGNFTDNILVDVFTVSFISIISCLIVTVPFLCAIDIIVNPNEESKSIDPMQVLLVISEAFLFFPVPKVLWAALYVVNAFLMTLSSQAIYFLALAEALQNIFMKRSMKFWVVIVSGVSSVLTIAVGALRIEAYVDVGTAVTVNFFLSTWTWQIFYGIENFRTDFHFMMGYPVPFLIRSTWITLLILPLVFLSLTIFTRRNSLLHNLHDFVLSGFVLLLYILNILFCMIRKKKRKEKIITAFTANPDWGPENPLLRKSRKMFGVSSVTREFTYRQELNKKPLVKPPQFSEQNIVYLT